MSTYFMLECFAPVDQTVSVPIGHPDIDGVESWILGSRFEQVPPQPIALRWDPSQSGPKKSFYDGAIPLMRRALVDALQTAGVDNIDCYEAAIVDEETQVVDDGYVAVNVIGAVAAADLGLSHCADPSGRRRIDMDFDSLVLKAKAPRGVLMFRLAECTTGLVVHARVKQHLEQHADLHLNFIPPEEWVG